LSADQSEDLGKFGYGRSLELGVEIGIDVSEAVRYLRLLADEDYTFGVVKWADCLEYGKSVGADAYEAARYYKKFIDDADRMKEYNLDDFWEIVVGNGMTLEVSNRAESIAALVGYAREHWESCVAVGRSCVGVKPGETR
jgi:TPR repeat protein